MSSPALASGGWLQPTAKTATNARTAHVQSDALLMKSPCSFRDAAPAAALPWRTRKARRCTRIYDVRPGRRPEASRLDTFYATGVAARQWTRRARCASLAGYGRARGVRAPQDVPPGRADRRGAPGRLALGRARRAGLRHRPERLGEEHAAPPRGGPRPADLRERPPRRTGPRAALRRGDLPAAPPPAGVRLPVLQPAPDADGARERGAAAAVGRRGAGE